MIFSLKRLLELFKSIWNPVTKQNNRLIFFHTAVQALGTDASPNDIVPDELGCAETINDIHKKAFGFPIGGEVSTYRMYSALKNSTFFKRVGEPLEGRILISPTGYGKIDIMSGHVGIVGEMSSDGTLKVMTNDSFTGKFIDTRYSIKTWKKRWADKGKYPMWFFDRI